MTKKEARKLARYLDLQGWMQVEIVRYERSWRVYATDPVSGYTKHWDRAAGEDGLLTYGA